METQPAPHRLSNEARQVKIEKRLRLAILSVFIVLLLVGAYGILKFFQARNAPPRNYYDYQLRVWKAAAAQGSKNPAVYTNIGYIYLNMDRPGDALYYLEKALKLNPKFVPALYNMGLYYKKEGDFDKAARLLTKAAREATDNNKFLAYFSLGEMYQDRKQYDKAIENYEKALADNATIWNTHYRLGQVYEKLGKKDKALGSYKSALRFNPSNDTLNNKITELSK